MSSFLSYTPVELAFGTSGMRGLVSDITDLEAYISVKGALLYLRGRGESGDTVVLGGDLRPSTDRILRASLQAIVDAGFSVEHVGKLPTPALVLHSIEQGRAGVMVTGSHIPFDRNGIKVNKSAGELLKSDEPGVLAEIARVRAEEYARTAETSAFDARGMLKRTPVLPPPREAAVARYRRRYLDAFAGALEGWRIAFYQHSAVGRDLIPAILTELGAEVVPVERSDTFVPIDTENISDADLARFAAIARAHAPLDAIVSTDGDSDRPLMVAVQGEEVRFLPGDLLGLVVAEELHADAVSVPISANDAIDLRLGARVKKTRIGSPYVIESLAEQRRGGAERVVGWEANGGFLVGSTIDLTGKPLGTASRQQLASLAGMLAPLPTRDALLPIVVNLMAAPEQDLVARWSALPQRFGRAGLIDGVAPPVSRAILAYLSAESVPRHFTRALGFGAVEKIDRLDGVRIWFEGGDVAHLRASGNAPQLRIYANAATQARADEIVAHGLREPDGILRTLEKAVG
jgi:phosphomannomutase